MDFEATRSALGTMQPGNESLSKKIANLIPEIEAAIAKGVTQVAIAKQLSATLGAKISQPFLNKILAAERRKQDSIPPPPAVNYAAILAELDSARAKLANAAELEKTCAAQRAAILELNNNLHARTAELDKARTELAALKDTAAKLDKTRTELETRTAERNSVYTELKTKLTELETRTAERNSAYAELANCKKYCFVLLPILVVGTITVVTAISIFR